jgi:hypothetical protein
LRNSEEGDYEPGGWVQIRPGGPEFKGLDDQEWDPCGASTWLAGWGHGDPLARAPAPVRRADDYGDSLYRLRHEREASTESERPPRAGSVTLVAEAGSVRVQCHPPNS